MHTRWGSESAPPVAARDRHLWEHWICPPRRRTPQRDNLPAMPATVTLVFGLSSFCLVVTGWAAALLVWAVDWLAQSDLEKIRAGRMGPNGWLEARRAQELADYACVLGFVGGVFFGLPQRYGS